MLFSSTNLLLLIGATIFAAFISFLILKRIQYVSESRVEYCRSVIFCSLLKYMINIHPPVDLGVSSGLCPGNCGMSSFGGSNQMDNKRPSLGSVEPHLSKVDYCSRMSG